MGKSEQIQKRRENEASVLFELHREEPRKRGALSDCLGMRKSSLSNIVADFLERGVLVDDPPGAARSSLRLNAEHWRTLVGHVEPGGLRVAAVRFDGEIEAEERSPLSERMRPEAILSKLAAMFAARMGGLRKKGLAGIGVAIPGITDANSGRGVHAVNLAGWDGVEVSAPLEKALGHPVAVENDVRCQLLGNAWFRPEVFGCTDAYYVSLQKSMASAALVDGEILRGRRFAAGEIGCMRAGDRGRECRCGKKDCLQTYASAGALLTEVNHLRHQAPLSSIAELVEAAGTDASITGALDLAIEPLVRVLATAVGVLDPEAVLLATDDVGFAELLRPLIELRLNRELLGLYTRGISVIVADNAEDATLRGMASILIKRAFGNGMVALV